MSLAMPLNWSPTESLKDVQPGALEAFAGQRVMVPDFKDQRTDASKIGSNVEDANPRPVSTTDDVAAFVTAHFSAVLEANGVVLVKGNATRVIRGVVLEFFVTESDTYKGKVVVEITLEDARGRELWRGKATGESQRFGRSLSADNYNETLSDSIVGVVRDLTTQPAFQAAMRAKH
jgi:hypothetical protein